MDDPIKDEKFLGTVKTAALFDVTPETVVSWIKSGKLRAVKINKRWRVPISAIKEFGEAKYHL